MGQPTNRNGKASRNPLRDSQDRRLISIAGPCALVLFGVTGDLARKKLLPAIYDLARNGLLPPSFSLVGFGRRPWSQQDFTEFVREAVTANARTEFNEIVWEQLSGGFRFISGEFGDDAAYETLRETLEELETERGTGGNVAFYLSIPPARFELVSRMLVDHRLAGKDVQSETNEHGEKPWRRVVIEKPFGHDLASARELNDIIEQVFAPDDVFRIDHYLGKETVQNLLALRFANRMFEPIWNSNHVDHVQITMAENIGIEGRAGYYDGVGAARDVIQNHLLQLLALTAMEEPLSYEAADLRAEKEKILRAVIVPEDLGAASARGQYAGGWQGGVKVKGFLEEEGFNPNSQTETYAALKLHINNRRWHDVPFYIRTGKRLGRRVTEIAVIFKKVPNLLFTNDSGADSGPGAGQNTIVIRVQPDEGVTIRFASKVPGAHAQVRDVTMDFGYGHAFTEDSPEAYERLILDVLLGDPPLFPRHEEVEESWRILDPFENYWAELDTQPEPYAPGSWGPASADELMARDGRAWRRP